VISEVLMATSMKTAVFWDLTLCSQVDTDRRFSLIMEAVSYSAIKLASELHIYES
jgi:hypothetical protein